MERKGVSETELDCENKIDQETDREGRTEGGDY